MHISDTTIYLGDNGRALCGQHLGISARTTGRDLSGQAIAAVTPDIAREAQAMGWTVACEQCGRVAS